MVLSRAFESAVGYISELITRKTNETVEYATEYAKGKAYAAVSQRTEKEIKGFMDNIIDSIHIPVNVKSTPSIIAIIGFSIASIQILLLYDCAIRRNLFGSSAFHCGYHLNLTMTFITIFLTSLMTKTSILISCILVILIVLIFDLLGLLFEYLAVNTEAGAHFKKMKLDGFINYHLLSQLVTILFAVGYHITQKYWFKTY